MPEELTKQNLIASIKNEEERYNIPLDINPSFARTQKSILDLVEFYYMSKYRDGDRDTLGQHKVFYNIVNLPVEVAAKTLDIDTKNIRLQGEDWDSYWTSWLKGKELDFWMKDKYFGRQLNIYPLYLAKYGHLFLKKVKDEVMIVNPRQIIVRPDAESLKETPILEYHRMQKDAYYSLAEKSGWADYKLSALEEKENPYVEFYEAYYPDGFFNDKYNYFIVRPGAQKIMVASKLETSPYKALAWEKVPSRFLGRGQVEKLFEDQIYLNRLANYKAEGLAFTSKHTYQTRDNNAAKNLLTGTDNGDILFVSSEITPIATEERNLGFYSYEEARWENTAMRKAFTSEPMTGERAPSGVPLGSTMLQAQMSTTYYDQKKEDLGSFIEEVIWDWVLPEFEKQNRKEHKILVENLISGTDDYSDKFFNFLLAKRMRKKKLDMMSQGKWLSNDQYKIIEGIQADLLRKEPFTVEKGAYDNLKHKVNIDIVGEHVDTPAKLATLQVLMQMLSSNPAIFQDKKIRKIIYKALDLSGFNPNDFDFEDGPTETTMSATQGVAAQRGGSLSVPKVSTLPTALPQTAYSSNR